MADHPIVPSIPKVLAVLVEDFPEAQSQAEQGIFLLSISFYAAFLPEGESYSWENVVGHSYSSGN